VLWIWDTVWDIGHIFGILTHSLLNDSKNHLNITFVHLISNSSWLTFRFNVSAFSGYPAGSTAPPARETTAETLADPGKFVPPPENAPVESYGGFKAGHLNLTSFFLIYP
jgi:hypothetical protein